MNQTSSRYNLKGLCFQLKYIFLTRISDFFMNGLILFQFLKSKYE